MKFRRQFEISAERLSENSKSIKITLIAELIDGHFLYLWGILVKLVICVLPGHWKTKILNLKNIQVWFAFYVIISHPMRKKCWATLFDP